METFWRHGFEATSIDDLTRALGVGRASLYATFNSKQELYERALDLYRARETTRMLTCLDSKLPPHAQVAQLFERVAGDACADPENRGCFMLNAALERAADDPSTATRVRATMQSIEGAFRALLERAEAAGELPPGSTPTELASFLTCALQGVRALAKATRDERAVRDAVSVTLRVLEPPAVAPV